MIIDFNNRCLPNMSDGASSVDEAISLLNELKNQNILNVFLTPVYLNTGETVRAFIARRNYSYNLIAKKLPRGMHLYLCAKILFMPDTLDNIYISKLTYKSCAYIFLVLPTITDLSWIEDELYYLLHKAKLVPVFVNFDSYRQIFDEQIYHRLMEIPYAVYQFNAESLLNTENVKNINKLCTDGKTVVFGSNTPSITPDIYEFRKNIENLKTLLPINLYRQMMMNTIKLYNRIIH